MSDIRPILNYAPPPRRSAGKQIVRFYGHFAAAYGTFWLLLFAIAILFQTHVDAGLFGFLGFPIISAIYATIRLALAQSPDVPMAFTPAMIGYDLSPQNVPPISLGDLRNLFSYLFESRQACDHSHRRTRQFLEERSLPVPETIAWLFSQGGSCDCCVIVNVSGRRAQRVNWNPDITAAS